MITSSMMWLLLGCAVVTWLPRILPFVFVKNMILPPIILRWLAYIPVCILSALVMTNLFDASGSYVTFNWPILAAFIPTILIAIWTKSLSTTVIVGVICMATIRFIF